MMIFTSESGSHSIPPSKKNPAPFLENGQARVEPRVAPPLQFFHPLYFADCSSSINGVAVFHFLFRSNLEQLAVPKFMSFLFFPLFVLLTGGGFPGALLIAVFSLHLKFFILLLKLLSLVENVS
jgi:hypothetical protein